MNPPEKDANNYSAEEMNADLEFIRTSVLDIITPEVRQEIQIKLNKTVMYRKELMAKIETNVVEEFPFFFTHPSLVRKFFFLNKCQVV